MRLKAPKDGKRPAGPTPKDGWDAAGDGNNPSSKKANVGGRDNGDSDTVPMMNHLHIHDETDDSEGGASRAV